MKITIHTGDRVLSAEAEPGARLDDLVLAGGVLLDRQCSGRGTCGKCRVRVKGELSPLSAAEQKHLSPEDRGRGVRLACQARAAGDAEIWLDSRTVFTDKTFSSGVDLSEIAGPFGLAFDLGTTTVAAFLVGLSDEKVFAGHAVLNRQATHGAEVMSRLLAAEKNRDALRELAWQSMIEAAAGLQLAPEVRRRIKKAAVVGNSAMNHLALARPVASLLRSPFEPASLEPATVLAGPLLAFFPELSEVVFPPLIGGFVGSDALACLLYFGFGHEEKNALALDLGTNGELMLAAPGKIFAASTAAGPAFEGVNISCGMRATPGAVTAVSPHPGPGLTFTTIADAEPIGLAGSGLLSAVRALRELGVIERSGRIAAAPGERGLIVAEKENGRRIQLTDRIALTQPDVRELQKAKAAVRAAVEILLERAGLAAEELSRVILTGSFGGKIAPEDALALGVLPPVPRSRIYAIPNGAGLGAAMMLSPVRFEEARQLAKQVTHVELNLDVRFMDRYIDSMDLP